ncbi:MAG: hypothetical protein KGD68_08765 [Candidatus Lokiarchaeota archaeon]|nr:hypothetical protein [Candidatus Lokiarchaeota archaeon]
MTYLTDEEIEKLKLIHPKKRYIRYLFLAIGMLIIFLGCLFTFIGYDFGITLNGSNLSLIVNILIIIFGGIITSKYYITPYYIRENSLTFKKMRDLREPVEEYVKFNSFAITRLMASILLILNGLISYTIFGVDVGYEIEFGSAILFGGPSWFYVTGFPMLITGLGLLVYFILSPFRGIFSKSKNFLFFSEIRPGFAWLSEIPKKDIEFIRFQNNHTGPKLAWIILIIPFIVLQLMTAIPLLAAEKAGPEFVLSWTFIVLSIIDIIVLVVLVIFQQNYFEIATKEKLYEMWFSPIKLKNQSHFKENFANFLECNPNLRDTETNGDDKVFSSVNSTNFQLFKLIFGLFLITIALIMLTQMVLFGPQVWWFALMYGLMLLVKTVFYDFSKKNGDVFKYNEESKEFRFKRDFLHKFHYIAVNKVESLSIKKWYRKIDFFDVFGICGLLVFLTLQQLEGWIAADTLTLRIDNLISTLLWILVIAFIIFYLCFPIDFIEIKSPSITHRVQITQNLKEISRITQCVKNLKNFPKEIMKPEMKNTFLIRMGIILALIFGSLIYMAVYFVFSF